MTYLEIQLSNWKLCLLFKSDQFTELQIEKVKTKTKTLKLQGHKFNAFLGLEPSCVSCPVSQFKEPNICCMNC